MEKNKIDSRNQKSANTLQEKAKQSLPTQKPSAKDSKEQNKEKQRAGEIERARNRGEKKSTTISGNSEKEHDQDKNDDDLFTSKDTLLTGENQEMDNEPNRKAKYDGSRESDTFEAQKKRTF